MASRQQLEHVQTVAPKSTRSVRPHKQASVRPLQLCERLIVCRIGMKWMVTNGRLLFEGQEKGRDERPAADHDEERQAGNSGHMPDLRNQDLQDRQVQLIRLLKKGRLITGGPFSFV